MPIPTDTETETPTDSEARVYDEPWAKALVDIVNSFVEDERSVRDRQVRQWRKMMRYWDGYQFLWWSEIAHDWRTPGDLPETYAQENDIDPSLYAKVINIYRANGEVIIAAMSATIPGTLFPPDDADNPDDILASKSKTKLAKVIADHNQGDLLLTKILFILFNQGLVGIYNENIQSEEFGTVTVKEEGLVKVKKTDEYCSSCGGMISETEDPPAQAVDPEVVDAEDPQEFESDEAPDDSTDVADLEGMDDTPPVDPEGSAGAQSVQPANIKTCPTCGTEGPTELETYPSESMRVTGSKEVVKCREVVTAWGPLNIQVPFWCSSLSASPYLILETEEHTAMLQDVYPEIQDKISSEDGDDSTDRSARYPNSYLGEVPRDLATFKRIWLRKWAFNKYGHDKGEKTAIINDLKKRFPDGCYISIIGSGLIGEVVPDKLDDHWTLTASPISEAIHAEPLGAPLIDIQEMVNEVVNLTLESIEHQIPETFADNTVLDFDQYKQSESRPGTVFPVRRKTNESISNAFYEIKGGSLSKEVGIFTNKLEDMGRFSVGALPSVFGGQMGETAKEYEMSRAQALQRLGMVWRMVNRAWIEAMDKSVTSYASNMVDDERQVEYKGGSYINIWIRKSELEGKTGRAFPESSDVIPLNWNQKRDVMIQMMQMKDERIGEVLGHPENASFVARLIGLEELYIPGDRDRTKQMLEISEMIMAQPIEMPAAPMMGPDGLPQVDPMAPPQMQSSVEIDPEIDDNEIEGEICDAWLKGEVGQDMKRTNPAAYLNVRLHRIAHKQAAMQKAMEEASMMGPAPEDTKGSVPPEKGPEVANIGI